MLIFIKWLLKSFLKSINDFCSSIGMSEILLLCLFTSKNEEIFLMFISSFLILFILFL